MCGGVLCIGHVGRCVSVCGWMRGGVGSAESAGAAEESDARHT